MRSLVFLVVLAGCFGDSHSCPQYGTVAKEPAQIYRDPSTGQCQAFNTGGGYPCDPQCGPCAEPAGAAALPDWASCSGPCSSLDEQQCLQSTTCHAAYSGGPGPTPTFLGCWDLPPTGAVTGGSCSGLDAQTCSEHPDCTSLIVAQASPPFQGCNAKTPPPACSTLATETDCKARPDCDPIYIGMNCTCTPNGCTCAIETYDHCQAR